MSILSVPLKTVLLWHADLQNETPPTDYAVCDGRTLTSGQQDVNPGGSYTVPDLRNVFPLGADLTKAAGTAGSSADGAGSAPGPKGTGGTHNVTLSTGQMPSHSHGLSGSPSISDPGHGHNYRAETSGGGGSHYGFVGASSGSFTDYSGVVLSTGTGISAGIGSLGISSAGSGSGHENRPVHYGLVFIMKVKI